MEEQDMFGTARWTVLADDLRTPQHMGDRGYSGHTSMITRVAFVVMLCLIKHSSLRNVLIKHVGYMCLLGGGFSPYLGKLPILAKNSFNGGGNSTTFPVFSDLEFLPPQGGRVGF